MRANEPDAIDLARALDALEAEGALEGTSAPSATARIEGVVTDDAGTPLEGAAVRASTEADGRDPDPAESSRSLSGPECAGEEVRAAAASAARRIASRPRIEGVTDAEGRFSLDAPGGVPRVVRASRLGWGSAAAKWSGSESGPPVHLRLRPRAIVVVRLEGCDPALLGGDFGGVYLDGAPSGFEDAVATRDDASRGAPTREATFEAAPGTWTAIAYARSGTRFFDGRETFTIPRGAPASRIEVAVEMKRRAVLTVRAIIPAGEPCRPEVIAAIEEVGEGRPRSGDEIAADSSRRLLVVDEDGERLFAECPGDRALEPAGASPGEMVETIRASVDPGRYLLTVGRGAQWESHPPFSAPMAVEIGPEGAEVVARLAPLPEEGIVRIVVEGPHGEPVPDAFVEGEGAQRIESDGAVQVFDLRACDASPARLTVHGDFGRRTVDVPWPRPRELRVRLEIPGRLHVAIVDAYGRPVEPGSVAVSLRPDRSDVGTREGYTRVSEGPTTSDDGDLVFDPVQPGPWLVVVRAAGERRDSEGDVLAWMPVTISSGESRITVALPAPTSLTVRAGRGRLELRDALRQRLEWGWETLKEPASVRFDGLRPGPWIVLLSRADLADGDPALYARRVELPYEGILDIGPASEGSAAASPRAEARAPRIVAREGRPPRALASATARPPPAAAPVLASEARSAAGSSLVAASPSAASPVTSAAARAFDAAALRLATPSSEERRHGDRRIEGVVRDRWGAAIAGVTVAARLLDAASLATGEPVTAPSPWEHVPLREDLRGALRILHEKRAASAATFACRSDPGGAYVLEGLPAAAYRISTPSRSDMRLAIHEGRLPDAWWEHDVVTATARCDVTTAREVQSDEPVGGTDTAAPSMPPIQSPADATISAPPSPTAPTPSAAAPAAEEAPAPSAARPSAPSAESAPAAGERATLRVRVRLSGGGVPLTSIPGGPPRVYAAMLRPDAPVEELRGGEWVDEHGEATLEGLAPGSGRLVLAWETHPRYSSLSPQTLRRVELAAGFQEIEVEVHASPLTIVAARPGSVFLWSLEAPVPFLALGWLEVRARGEVPCLAHGRWLAVFVPDVFDAAEVPADAPGLVPQLERRFTTPDTTEIRFD